MKPRHHETVGTHVNKEEEEEEEADRKPNKT